MNVDTCYAYQTNSGRAENTIVGEAWLFGIPEAIASRVRFSAD